MTGEVAVPHVGGWSSASASPAADSATGTRPESWEERFSAAVPLFLVGSACVVVAVELYFSGTVTALGGSSVLLRPWILFVALGITGLGAGTIVITWCSSAAGNWKELSS